MIKEVEKYKDEDKMYMKKVEARIVLEKYAYNMRNDINDKDISLMLSSKEEEKINKVIDLVFTWLDVNEVAEQQDFEYYTSILLSVFDAVILKKIKDEGHVVQEGTMVGNAVNNKKNR